MKSVIIYQNVPHWAGIPPRHRLRPELHLDAKTIAPTSTFPIILRLCRTMILPVPWLWCPKHTFRLP